MQIDHEPNMSALRRDWLGARIVGGVGLVFLLGAAVIALSAQWSAVPPSDVATLPAPPPEATPPPPEVAPPSDVAVLPVPPPDAPAAPPSGTPAPAAPPATAPGDAIVPPLSIADQHKAENIAICNTALATAQQQRLLPASAKLASDQIASTDVRGRYICLYKTDASRYSVDFDLTCTNLSQDGCIWLYTVSQAGGGVLYQRK